MAVIALTSARGAPGVTTTAAALAFCWPRPLLLIEADAAGSSLLPGYLRQAAVSTRQSALAVAPSLPSEPAEAAAALLRAAVPLPGSSTATVLPSTLIAAHPSVELWDWLAAAVDEVDLAGTDVLIDAGRLGAQNAPDPLLSAAFGTLLTTRTTRTAAEAAGDWVPYLRELTGPAASALLVVGEGQPLSHTELTAQAGMAVAAVIGWDPVHAEVFSLGATPGHRLKDSLLLRTIRTAIEQLSQWAARPA